MSQHFVTTLQQQVEKYREKTIFHFLQNDEVEAGSLTYAEIDRQARGIAVQLANTDRNGEHALLLFPPGLMILIVIRIRWTLIK